jgi:hypothetical protein
MMERRAFVFGTAGIALGASVATGQAGAAAHSGGLITTYVANLREHGGRTGVPSAGTKVALMRERDREYDPLSIAVIAPDGRKLGYLPAVHGAILAPLMDAGLRFEAAAGDGASGSNPRLELLLEPRGITV